MTIFGPGPKYTNPREAASRARAVSESMPHSLYPQQIEMMHQRFDSWGARRVGTPVTRVDKFFDGIMPPNMSLGPGAGSGFAQAKQATDFKARTANPLATNSGMASLGTATSPQRPYMPEFDSPDRQNYPVHHNLANIYWRMFYKLDPIVGAGIDTIADLVFSEFQLTGEGVDGEVKQAFEDSVEATQLLVHLPYMPKEYMVVGEVAPHTFWDDNLGIWTHLALHNPNQLEVVYSPFLQMEPIIEFRPDDKIRQIMTSTNPYAQRAREMIPAVVQQALSSGQNIPLSPINCSFLARRMQPNDTRGTSIMSRMWRDFMYEDSQYTTSIAVSRRAGAPVKVAKLGDAATGWIPGPEQEERVLDMLVNTEMDPVSWFVFHYAINFDLVGSQERAWKVDQSAEYLLQRKLMAMGISKAFLWGEVTYASAQSGLQVFLKKLRTLRSMFENQWLLPKFFRQISQLRGFIKPTEAELAHGVRVKRSQRELDESRRYIVPRIEWKDPLDPSIDASTINAVETLERNLPIKFSPTTKMSLANRSFEKELAQAAQDSKKLQQVLQANPQLAALLSGGGEGGGGGGGGMGMLPPLPSNLTDGGGGGEVPMPDEGGPPPEEAPPGPPPEAAEGASAPHGGSTPPSWPAETVDDLRRVLEGYKPSTPIWSDMVAEWQRDAKKGSKHALRALRALGDADAATEEVTDWLLLRGMPPRDVRQLQRTLKNEQAKPAQSQQVPENLGSDRDDDWVRG